MGYGHHVDMGRLLEIGLYIVGGALGGFTLGYVIRLLHREATDRADAAERKATEALDIAETARKTAWET